MGKHMRLIFMLTLIMTVWCGSAYGQDEIIKNHSFGVLRSKYGKAHLYIRNDGCKVEYRVVANDKILGEGKLDLRNEDLNIPFEERNLHLSCNHGDIEIDER